MRVFPPVPGRVFTPIAQSEIGRQVDDGRRQRLESIDLLAGFTMRQRHEQHVDRLQGSTRLELEFGAPSQVRMDAVHELAAQALGGDLRHLDLGVREKQTKQLAAGIAGSAHDRRFHRASCCKAVVSTWTPR